MRERRLMAFFATTQALERIFTEGSVWSVLKGIPEGGEIKAVNFDHVYDRFHFTVQHESFEEVNEGAAIPTFVVMFERKP